MASAKLTPEGDSDLPPHSSLPSLAYADPPVHASSNFGSINMDELLANMYADSGEFPTARTGDGGGSSGGGPFSNIEAKRAADYAWEGTKSAAGAGASEPKMTLEDFLTQAGAVSEEEVRLSAMPQPLSEVGAGEMMMHAAQFSSHPLPNEPGGYGLATVGFGNGIDARAMNLAVGVSGGVGRGKRRTAEEPAMNMVSQQRQKRMIKNRESAARSRDRKHAYTVELEALVTKLEEENSQLLREEAEQAKERFKQLMENLIPVVEKRRPPRVLRRVHSMCW